MRTRHNPPEDADGNFFSDWESLGAVPVTYTVTLMDGSGVNRTFPKVTAEDLVQLRLMDAKGKIVLGAIVANGESASSSPPPSAPRVAPQARPASDTSDPPPPKGVQMGSNLSGWGRRERAAEKPRTQSSSHTGITALLMAKVGSKTYPDGAPSQAQARVIFNSMGGVKNCANWEEAAGMVRRALPDELIARSKKPEHLDKVSRYILMVMGVTTYKKAHDIIEALIKADLVKLYMGTDGSQFPVPVFKASEDTFVPRQGYFNERERFLNYIRPDRSRLNQLAYAMDGNPILNGSGVHVTIGQYLEWLHEIEETAVLAGYKVAKEHGLNCAPGFSRRPIKNPRGLRSLALNNSGYPDTMIALPYPRKDYDFAPPPIVAHYTSYPQYAYDQFYPDPGRLAWTGPSSAPQENPSKTRGRKPRKNPFMDGFPEAVKPRHLQPQLLIKNLYPSDKIWIGYELNPNTLTAAQRQQYKDKKYTYVLVATTDPAALPPGYPTYWGLYEPGVHYKGLDELPPGLAPGQVWAIPYKSIRVMP